MSLTVTANSMAIIKIEFFNEAEDELDADAMVRDRAYYCFTIAQAEAALGLLERSEKFPVKEITEF